MIENKGSVTMNNSSGIFPFERHLYAIMVYKKCIEILYVRYIRNAWLCLLCGIWYVGICHHCGMERY